VDTSRLIVTHTSKQGNSPPGRRAPGRPPGAWPLRFSWLRLIQVLAGPVRVSDSSLGLPVRLPAPAATQSAGSSPLQAGLCGSLCPFKLVRGRGGGAAAITTSRNSV
jgi:hypothetical protein